MTWWPSVAMPDLEFLVFLVVDGVLVGAIYALVALAFVVVYKASRMINFAVGECVVLASRLVAFGQHGLGLGVGGGLAVGCAGMVALMVGFNEVVLRRLAGRPVIALIMITIGLATLLRGAAALLLGHVPAGIIGALPEPVVLGGVSIAVEKAVVPPLVLVSASPPFAPLVRSQARKVIAVGMAPL